ncbi:MAG: dipeptidase [Ignavibacteriales bacterium]|nr:dipeptidase [Ignavibacteriales bacterium]
MEKVKNYILANYDSYVEELKDFLKIPSISTMPENRNDVAKAAEFVAGKLKTAGLSQVEIYKTENHPIVYGEWLGAPGKPTLLVYGHYDVQPVDPIELWTNPPFEPIIKDGKIWARGATDDKGQMFVHIKSVEAFFKTYGSLPINIKFLIEGEEEIGSESLGSFLEQNKDLLKCDAVLVSDTSMYAPGVPSLTYGLRGLAYLEIEITGPNKDLHSGSFGGAVSNPINVLTEIIAKLHDKNGKVTIPNFYKNVIKITKKEKDNFGKLKFSDKKYAKELGVAELSGEKGFSTLERLWTRPTLDCNGIWGGFIGAGAKTVIPSKATAKISMRLVPNQDPNKIANLFTKYIKSITPKSVKVNVRNLHGGYPVLVPLEDKIVSKAAIAMEKAFGKKTIFMREGGSIPIVVEFVKSLKIPAILMGLGLDSENAHSPDEHMDLSHFKYGLLCSAYFIDELSS